MLLSPCPLPYDVLCLFMILYLLAASLFSYNYRDKQQFYSPTQANLANVYQPVRILSVIWDKCNNTHDHRRHLCLDKSP